MDVVKRTELVAELKLAHDEAARLDEMISLLQTGRGVDEGRLAQLRLERLIAAKRAYRLHDELRELDAGGNDQNAVA
jgi:hypothetical protein